MEGNESGLASYYHHHHHHTNTTTTTAASSGTNGIFSSPHHHHHHHHHHNNNSNNNTSSGAAHYSSSDAAPLAFPLHSVTGRAPPVTAASAPPETARRKRGRPRKYGISEVLPTASSASASSAKRVSASPSLPLSPSTHKKQPNLLSSPKKAQMVALGNAGQGFMPHVIAVAAGEDVAQKIMSFMQQRKRAVCIISASGSISNASLRQPASLGGNVTYEGRFEIISLSGSFLHTEIGGTSSRTGGLSICLSGSDGCIVGGGVGGPLKAAGPVQVIAGSFVIDTKKEMITDPKLEISGSKVPHVIGATVSSISFQSVPDCSGTSVRRNDDHQTIGGNNFILQPRGLHMLSSQSSDWRSGLDSTSAFSGRTDHGGCPSPEEGDDEHLQD